MEDILESRRLTGDWWWVLRDWESPVYHKKKTRSPKDIQAHVLKSELVQHAIAQVAAETSRPVKDVEKEAQKIISQMGHNFTMKAIRFFGVLLAKSWKRLYRGVFVNKDGIETLKKLVPEYPIILMPTHRSYMDFLIISYAFYHYDLPLPIIASGQDFVNMSVMGSLMRCAGAFFIRRSFGKDKLYWSVFSEYVRTHIINGDAPLEFFVEGTRSRSAKSLFPKLGLFTAALEPFFKSEVPDIMVVPISVSYDRTLEEVLYAYENLGIPKPKESTKGLLQARKILDDDFGNFFMNVGEPISLRNFCGTKIDRTVHNFGPKHLSPITQREHLAVEELAYDIIRRHQSDLVFSPFVAVALLLMCTMQEGQMTIPLDRLIEGTRDLLSLLKARSVRIHLEPDADLNAVVRDVCKVHHNVVKITADDTVHILELHSETPSASSELRRVLPEEVMKKAVTHVLLSHYSNQMLHSLYREGLIVIILKAAQGYSTTKENLLSDFQFLSSLLQYEFVSRANVSEELELALVRLSAEGTIALSADDVNLLIQSKTVPLLLGLFLPFVLAYRLVCTTLLNDQNEVVPETPKVIAKKVQQNCLKVLTTERLFLHTILSVEMLTNGVFGLASTGALHKELRDGSTVFRTEGGKLYEISRRLGNLCNHVGGSMPLALAARAKL